LFLIAPFILFGKTDIYNLSAKSDTVDFGLCLVGESLETVFTIQNGDPRRLKIGKTLPSYFLGQLPGYGIEFEEFNEDFPLPQLIEKTDFSRNLTFKYNTKADLVKYPIGKKRAFLKLSVYDTDVEFEKLQRGDTLTENDLITTKKYILIARKTLKYIDGWESEIRFDSVYINSDTARQIWKVQNSSNLSLNIDNQKLEMLSPITGGISEISLHNFKLPLNLPKKKTAVDWLITYSPTDLLGDSAQFELYFKPNPAIPTLIDTAKVRIYGIGVKQDLRLLQNGTYIKGDTIDFGDVWVNDRKEIPIIISNFGNLPFGSIAQKITNANNNGINTDFSISSFLKTNQQHLNPSNNDSMKIAFQPIRRGPFLAKLVFESDIVNRRIGAYPAFTREVVYYIKGNGIEPTIQIDKDSIDFGNVVLQPDCPRTRDLEFTINNNGNTNLVIYFGNVEPPFSVNPFDSLAPNAKKNIKLSFDANQLGSFQKTLTLVTNANPPNDKFKVYLKAQSVAPKSTDISIPKTLRSKPGTRISLPILVVPEDIINAKTYLDTLDYDKTLLEFYDFEKVGTASEAAQADIHELKDGGKLAIKLICPGNFNFIKSDTLIKLSFNTYLGEKIKTSINFTESVFGDGVCIGVLKSVPQNGVYSTDSVCGLEYKAIPRTKGIIQTSEINPNPAIDLMNINFALLEDSDLKIKIYNSFGNLERTIIDEKYKAGEYLKSISLFNLEQGFFFCEFLAGSDRIVLPLIIRR
jgi:hypothetical protein